MAALSPSSGYPVRENIGSRNLHIVKFAAVTGDDTYASGITSAIGYWANFELAGGSTLVCGVNVTYAQSTGIFTFQVSVAAQPVTLYIVSNA